MKCPLCASTDTKVINSRPAEEGSAIRRRRECQSCGRRFTTYERAQFEVLNVVKRSGRREAFDPNKLLSKLRIATNKRPVSEKTLQEFAYTFEDRIKGSSIDAQEIGKQALNFLRELDDVAYIRFLSVYSDFDSAERFLAEVRHMSGMDDAPASEVTDSDASPD